MGRMTYKRFHMAGFALCVLLLGVLVIMMAHGSQDSASSPWALRLSLQPEDITRELLEKFSFFATIALAGLTAWAVVVALGHAAHLKDSVEAQNKAAIALAASANFQGLGNVGLQLSDETVRMAIKTLGIISKKHDYITYRQIQNSDAPIKLDVYFVECVDQMQNWQRSGETSAEQPILEKEQFELIVQLLDRIEILALATKYDLIQPELVLEGYGTTIKLVRDICGLFIAGKHNSTRHPPRPFEHTRWLFEAFDAYFADKA